MGGVGITTLASLKPLMMAPISTKLWECSIALVYYFGRQRQLEWRTLGFPYYNSPQWVREPM